VSVVVYQLDHESSQVEPSPVKVVYQLDHESRQVKPSRVKSRRCTSLTTSQVKSSRVKSRWCTSLTTRVVDALVRMLASSAASSEDEESMEAAPREGRRVRGGHEAVATPDMSVEAGSVRVSVSGSSMSYL
jgi:hypothetical protein